MSCNKYKPQLYDYLSGQISEGRKTMIDAHLSECTECSKELSEIKLMKTAVKLSYGNVQVPLNLLDNIMSSIDMNKYSKIVKHRIKSIKELGLSLVAAGIVLFVLSFSPSDNSAYAQKNSFTDAIDTVRNTVTQSVTYINKGVSDITATMKNLDGITVRKQISKGE